MSNKDKQPVNDSSRYPYTGLGLIFGTAIGAGLSMIITGNVLWAGIGTAVGLIIGACTGAYYSKKA